MAKCLCIIEMSGSCLYEKKETRNADLETVFLCAVCERMTWFVQGCGGVADPDNELKHVYCYKCLAKIGAMIDKENFKTKFCRIKHKN